MSRHQFPSTEEGLVLHQRLLLDNYRSASNALCECYLDPLIDWLRGKNRRAHPDDCAEAAETALTNYFNQPKKFDPTKLALDAFLRMAARRDLLNLYRGESRHHRLRDHDFRVEEDGCVGNSLQDDPLTVLSRREEQADARRIVESIRVACSEPERVVLELLIDGERESIRYATPLGVEHLPEKEMRREVKRVQDRLKKRIERKGEVNDDPTGENGGAGAA